MITVGLTWPWFSVSTCRSWAPSRSALRGWQVSSSARYLLDLGALRWRLWTGSRRAPRGKDRAGLQQIFGRVWFLAFFGVVVVVFSTAPLQRIHNQLLPASIKSPGLQRTEKKLFLSWQMQKSLEILPEERTDPEPWFAMTFQHVLCRRAAAICSYLPEVSQSMLEVKHMHNHCAVEGWLLNAGTKVFLFSSCNSLNYSARIWSGTGIKATGGTDRLNKIRKVCGEVLGVCDKVFSLRSQLLLYLSVSQFITILHFLFPFRHQT